MEQYQVDALENVQQKYERSPLGVETTTRQERLPGSHQLRAVYGERVLAAGGGGIYVQDPDTLHPRYDQAGQVRFGVHRRYTTSNSRNGLQHNLAYCRFTGWLRCMLAADWHERLVHLGSTTGDPVSSREDRTARTVDLAERVARWLSVIGAGSTSAGVDFADSIAATQAVEALLHHLLLLDPKHPADAREAQRTMGEMYVWLFNELRPHLDELERVWDTIEDRLRVFAPVEADAEEDGGDSPDQR